MKKICFITTISGTIKSFLVDYAYFLVDKYGYDVTFICDNDDSMYSYCNEKIHYIPVSMKRGVNLDFLHAPYRLYRIFKRERFDIIQYSTPNAALYASIAGKLAGFSNRLYCQWGIRYMGYDSGVKRRLFKVIEKITCSCSTIIECESFSLWKFSISEGLYNADKSSVIGKGSACGVNLARYNLANKSGWRKEVREKLDISEDARVFGYCGRITRDKGLNELFAAFRRVVEDKKRKTDTYLLIIGQDDNAESINPELLAWAKSSPNVKFTGYTNNVPKYYSALDVFTSLSYREGFGLVVIEAAAMAVPAIVSNVPGQVDTIENGKTGLLVSVKNINEVVLAMNSFIANPVLSKKMGEDARIFVESKFEQISLFNLLALHKNQIIAEKS